jgi:hypothetical protein
MMIHVHYYLVSVLPPYGAIPVVAKICRIYWVSHTVTRGEGLFIISFHVLLCVHHHLFGDGNKFEVVQSQSSGG